MPLAGGPISAFSALTSATSGTSRFCSALTDAELVLRVLELESRGRRMRP